MSLDSLEQGRLRLAIFADLERFIEIRGGFATRDELVNFEIEGNRLGLIDRNRGIRNPLEFDSTLSIVTSPSGPYNDDIRPNGVIRYAFRSGDPVGGDNRKLRIALETSTPLILFEKPMPNVYVPVFPAYVIDENFDERYFVIATGEAEWRAHALREASEADRNYVSQVVQKRVHQPIFRARVMVAYSKTCTICQLKHPGLLDAAHIVPDSDIDGNASVTNGLALCKLHHAAFDQNLLGISGDYLVHINEDLLLEDDGPMLKHGLQEMHGLSLSLPQRKLDMPSRERLDVRFEDFLR
jgi:putative restriction endonuclease